MVSYTRLNRGSLDTVNGKLLPIDKTGLVGYWPMWQNGGTTAYDESKSGNDGTINGATWTWLTNFSKPALDFDGTDDWVDCGASVTDGLTAFTMIYWVVADSWTVNYNTCVRAENQIYHRFWSTSQGNRGIWIGDGSAWDVSTTDATAPTQGTWYMCTLRWDGSTFELLYDDAVSQLSVSSTISSTGSNTNVLGLANNPAQANEYLDGRMTNVLLYTRALSDAEIVTIYNKTKP